MNTIQDEAYREYQNLMVNEARDILQELRYEHEKD